MPVVVIANDVRMWPGATSVSSDCTTFVSVPGFVWNTIRVGSGLPLDDVSPFERDRATFHRIRQDLIREHAGKYVAIYNGKIAAVRDSDNDAARAFFASHPHADHVYIGFAGEESLAFQITPASR